MMKNLFFTAILLLLCIAITFGQRMPDTYGLNKVRITAPDKTITAELAPSDYNPSMETDRSYYWYGGNVIHTTQGGYSGRLLNGKYNEYYSNKNLKEQGIFKSGLKAGIWRSWDENGKLMQLTTWKKGIKSGAFSQYSDDGNIVQSGNYKNNILDGVVKNYHSKDSIETIRYKGGVPVKASIKSHPPFWAKFWPFKKHPAGEKKIKPEKKPKLKKQRKLKKTEDNATPQTKT